MSTVYKQVNGVKVALTSEELTAKAKACKYSPSYPS